MSGESKGVTRLIFHLKDIFLLQLHIFEELLSRMNGFPQCNSLNPQIQENFCLMSSKKEKILGESERQLVNEGLFYESMVNPREFLRNMALASSHRSAMKDR